MEHPDDSSTKQQARLLIVAAICACMCSCATAPPAAKKVFPKRWVYVSNPLATDQDVAALRQIVETAAAHGLNGMALAGLDRIDRQGPEYFVHLKQIKELCDRLGVAIIPSGFGTGYGGALLAHDPNLAEGLAVKRALFVAERGRAVFQPERAPIVEASSGVAPMTRFEKLLAVIPYRNYRLSVRVRGAGIAPGATLEIRADTLDRRRNRCWFEAAFSSGSGWREFTTGFNSASADKLNINFGIEDGLAGKVEIADLRIEEVGLLNVVRRAGTPLAVRGEKEGMVYEEGRDFAPVADPHLNFRFDHEGPSIQLTAGSRIREGERLRVDYYPGALIYKDQVPACMSEPKVFEIWSKQFPLIQKYLAPKTYLLSLDEERMGGTCETCRRRRMSMAAMLGDQATRLYDMVQAASPGAEVFVWSDLFDPNHNARGDYYLVDGDYSGSWRYLPKEMQIACWNFDTRDRSLMHFSKLGFKTLGAAYYDADDLTNPEGWLESLDRTPGAVGIMYTTWNNKYKLLPGFGDLSKKRE
jgi:hypothetical protein